MGRCVPAAECVSIESVTTPVGAHVRYVSASATSEGDRSRASPFATIGRAMEGAPADAWIVLDAGAYRATLTAGHAVNILGVCAYRVTIEGDASAPTLTAGPGASVLFRNVSVRGASELGVIAASAGASVTLEDSAITGGVGYGVFATGAGTSVTVVRSAIRAMRARSDGRRGWSVDGEGGARVRVEQSHIGDGTNIGVNASGRATSATVVDTVIESIRTGRTPGQGIGPTSARTLGSSCAALQPCAACGARYEGHPTGSWWPEARSRWRTERSPSRSTQRGWCSRAPRPCRSCASG